MVLRRAALFFLNLCKTFYFELLGCSSISIRIRTKIVFKFYHCFSDLVIASRNKNVSGTFYYNGFVDCVGREIILCTEPLRISPVNNPCSIYSELCSEYLAYGGF